MVKNMFLIASLATLVLLTPMVTSQASQETQERIDKICRSNEDYGFCNKVFQFNLHELETGYLGLAKIAITEAQKNASNTLGFIKAQIPGEEDPAQLDYYKVCEITYSILKKSFELAYYDFVKADYKKASFDERDTPRVQAHCVTIFSVPLLSKIDSLNERNREMRILITMAIISTSILLT